MQPERETSEQIVTEVHQLLSRFESLGDNCEFGVVQRYARIEPLGLFRWNSTTLPALMAVLGEEFANVDPENVELYTHKNGEFMVRLPPWGFQYHTHLFEGSIEPERLREQQVKVIGFLKRRMLEDLRSGEKIFVRKGTDTRATQAVLDLHRQLLRYGRNTLLWVIPEDESHPAGMVEVLETGLLRGYIDRFAPAEDAYDCSPVWLDLCRNTVALADASCPPRTIIMNPRRHTTNLLRRAFVAKDSSWWQAPSAASIPAEETNPPSPTGSFPKQHKLLEETDPRSGAICGYHVQGLTSGSVYVASAYVCIPEGARVKEVGLQLRGLPSSMVANADLNQRDIWQRVWVTARIPDGRDVGAPSLFVVGDAGSRIWSSAWQFEIGAVPTPYVSGLMGSMRGIWELRIPEQD